jgi:hypothetical protein
MEHFSEAKKLLEKSQKEYPKGLKLSFNFWGWQNLI